MINLEKALLSPASVFKDPHDVLKCQELSRQQKINILHHWAADARELEVAEEENMTAAPECESENRLNDILHALNELGAEINLEHSPPTKQGGETNENN